MPKLKTQSQVIEEFLQVHGQKYDYSKVKYENFDNSIDCRIYRAHIL